MMDYQVNNPHLLVYLNVYFTFAMLVPRSQALTSALFMLPLFHFSSLISWFLSGLFYFWLYKGLQAFPELVWDDPAAASHQLRNGESWDRPWRALPVSELSPLHHLLPLLEGRTSNPEKEKIMGDKDQCEIQIRCYKYTGKYMKWPLLFLTFHKCSVMRWAKIQHIFISCSGGKCLPDGFFLFI